jgi:thiol-disulfide isomerase/thioredoxin
MSTAVVMGLFLTIGGEAPAADRPAEAILKDLQSVEMPKFDASKQKDEGYIREFIKKRQDTAEKRASLILELYKTAPDDERIPALMVERWRSIRPTDSKADEIIKEIDEVTNQTRNPQLKLDAIFAKAQIKLANTRASGTPDLSVVEEFLKLAPKDPRCAALLYGAIRATNDQRAQSALEDRLVKDFADSQYAGMIKGDRRQHASIGKPFDLEFTDAIKGTTVSIAGLKGKVVVLDFWATWCGPCVAEMPKMKELYAKYHDQGLEFIGVSLDQSKEQGGLDKLKKFVAEKEIAWPQYYQGKGWESEFSMSWGINSIPCVFVVDGEGKLYSVDARGKLEEMIPELLKKKNGPAGAVAGGGQ